MQKVSRGLIVAIVAIGLVGAAALWWFSTGDAEPTTEITAPPIESTTTTEGQASPTTAALEPSGEIPTLYEIAPGSTATFTIDEELRGAPKTVVGVSSIVLGQIQIDPEDLSRSEIGTILVNARDFTTDSSNRNRAIRGPILDSEAVEFIEFTPTTIDGLSGPVQPGSPLTFTVTGDLKIRDVINQTSFEVTASIDDRGFLVGSAEATVSRSDFQLTIPNAPGVANVSDEVQLSLDFEAAPAS
jgi:polyisoprenoid-binding protein YceI